MKNATIFLCLIFCLAGCLGSSSTTTVEGEEDCLLTIKNSSNSQTTSGDTITAVFNFTVINSGVDNVELQSLSSSSVGEGVVVSWIDSAFENLSTVLKPAETHTFTDTLEAKVTGSKPEDPLLLILELHYIDTETREKKTLAVF